MGGIVQNVKEKVSGWLNDAFTGAKAAAPAAQTFSPRDIHGLFHPPRLMIPAEQLGRDYLLAQGNAIYDILNHGSDRHAPGDKMFLIAFRDVLNAMQDWKDHTPLSIEGGVLIVLHDHIGCVANAIDSVTQEQRARHNPAGGWMSGEVRALQKDIRRLENFNTQLQNLLNGTDAADQSWQRARLARMETGADTPFPPQWTL